MAIPLKVDPNDDWEAAYRRTPPGMAHLAGSGPDGKTCRECSYWPGRERYASGNADHAIGELKPAKCDKFKILMRREGKAVPHHAKACKHFKQSENVQVAVKANYQ